MHSLRLKKVYIFDGRVDINNDLETVPSGLMINKIKMKRRFYYEESYQKLSHKVTGK